MKRPFHQRTRFWSAAGLILAGTLAVLFWPEISAFLNRFHWADIRDAVRSSGSWAPLLCIGLNAVFTLLLLPTTLVCILVALLFDVGPGLAVCLVGLAIGMSLAFLLSRYVARDGLERRIGHTRLFRRLEENIQRDGWKIVLFSRLLPINPYSFLNYAYGLTGISFGRYLLASVVGITPNVLALLWTVHAAGQLATGKMDGRVIAILAAGAALFAVLAWLPNLLRRKARFASLPAPGEDEVEEEEDEESA